MPVTFTAGQFNAPQWHTLPLGQGNSIEIAIIQPTLEEQLQTITQSQDFSYQGFTLASTIKDWRGVIDPDGNPVPYSWSALNQLCRTYPDAVFELLAIRRKTLAGLTETERKNSPLPPDAGGSPLNRETTPETESSPTGANSDA